jgi:hypothetical protein
MKRSWSDAGCPGKEPIWKKPKIPDIGPCSNTTFDSSIRIEVEYEEKRYIIGDDNNFTVSIKTNYPTNLSIKEQVKITHVSTEDHADFKFSPNMVKFKKTIRGYELEKEKFGKHKIAFVDCRNVIHDEDEFMPSNGEWITKNNCEKVAKKLAAIGIAAPVPYLIYVISDKLGKEICDAIAKYLYHLISVSGKNMVMVSYTGYLHNGDDIIALKMSDYDGIGFPIISNDNMSKYGDLYTLKCTQESTKSRFIPDPHRIKNYTSPILVC